MDRSNLKFIIPTLAVQLARKYTKFRSILVPLARGDPGIFDESLCNQMDKLIVQPLVVSDIPTVIVIDALDECKDDEPASAFLSVLGQFVSKLPRVKFFVTGRPEPRIHQGFCLPQMEGMADVFVLHRVEPSQVDRDIQLLFRHSFSELSHRHRLGNWPSEDQLDLLCQRAAGLFVYAVATVKFIDHQKRSPEEQLDRLLKSSRNSDHEGKVKLTENTTLDSLYMSILQEAFGDDDPENDYKIRSVLSAVILAINPLSPSTIANLLDFKISDVLCWLLSVQSLLILEKEDVKHPVLPFHKSFRDFIINPSRCTNQRFCISPPDHHLDLLIGCLGSMNKGLEKNICKLPDAVMNEEVDDLQERVGQYIDNCLQYACRSWHKHLAYINVAPDQILRITPALQQFLEIKFLFWLEVLSVLDATSEAVGALKVAAELLKVCDFIDWMHFLHLLILILGIINS